MKTSQILVNWGHPVKLQMDERGFLWTALAWVLATIFAAISRLVFQSQQ